MSSHPRRQSLLFALTPLLACALACGGAPAAPLTPEARAELEAHVGVNIYQLSSSTFVGASGLVLPEVEGCTGATCGDAASQYARDMAFVRQAARLDVLVAVGAEVLVAHPDAAGEPARVATDLATIGALNIVKVTGFREAPGDPAEERYRAGIVQELAATATARGL